MSYSIWQSKITGDYASLDDLEGWDNGRRIHDGLPLAERFPKDVFFRMAKRETDDEEYDEDDDQEPESETLADCAYTTSGHLVISAAIQDRLKKAGAAKIEFLPVKILDRKGQVASSDYAILNALTVLDLIDKERSALKWNTIDPEKISSCTKIILKEPPPRGALLFRLKHFSRRLVIDNEVADRIQLRGFSGTKLTNLDEFRGF